MNARLPYIDHSGGTVARGIRNDAMYEPTMTDAGPGRVARAARRERVKVMAKLRQSGAKALEVEVHDLSTHGFQVDTVHIIRAGAVVWLQFAGFGPMEARVCWFRDYRIGCAFVNPLHPAVFDAILASAQAR